MCERVSILYYNLDYTFYFVGMQDCSKMLTFPITFTSGKYVTRVESKPFVHIF